MLLYNFTLICLFYVVLYAPALPSQEVRARRTFLQRMPWLLTKKSVSAHKKMNYSRKKRQVEIYASQGIEIEDLTNLKLGNRNAYDIVITVTDRENSDNSIKLHKSKTNQNNEYTTCLTGNNQYFPDPYEEKRSEIYNSTDQSQTLERLDMRRPPPPPPLHHSPSPHHPPPPPQFPPYWDPPPPFMDEYYPLNYGSQYHHTPPYETEKRAPQSIWATRRYGPNADVEDPPPRPFDSPGEIGLSEYMRFPDHREPPGPPFRRGPPNNWGIHNRGLTDNGEPPGNRGPPENRGPPGNRGPPENRRPPENRGPPEQRGPPIIRRPADERSPPEDEGLPENKRLPAHREPPTPNNKDLDFRSSLDTETSPENVSKPQVIKSQGNSQILRTTTEGRNLTEDSVTKAATNQEINEQSNTNQNVAATTLDLNRFSQDGSSASQNQKIIIEHGVPVFQAVAVTPEM